VAALNLEPQAARAAPRPAELQLQQLTTTLIAVLALALVGAPGLALGALWAVPVRWVQRPASRTTVSVVVGWAVALAMAAPLLAIHDLVDWGWPLRLAAAHVVPPMLVRLDAPTPTVHSVLAEALLGPLWFQLTVLAYQLRARTIGSQVVRDHRRDRRRWRAMRAEPARRPQPSLSDMATDPPGRIRLGLDGETDRPFDLTLAEIAQHVFLPGATGSGKTTTIGRLADGALANGFGVIVVDCKGGDLGTTAARLAGRHRVPLNVVDPDALPDLLASDSPRRPSLGYDPCSGDPADVANKLVGAFSYGPTAEIYKHTAMEAVPVVGRALRAAGLPLTLRTLYDAFGRGGMGALASRVPQPFRGELEELGRGGTVAASGYSGLQRRLGALRQGKFGPLFSLRPALDWDVTLAAPAVTYIALRATAASEDVELMARVIVQDLKQVCARRLDSMLRGEDIVPVLIVLDEFAALREAEQLTDLLLQARQAQMPTVVSTQYIPENLAIQKAVLGAGLLVAHRVEAQDADALAAQFGTRRSTDVTYQIDYATAFSEKGSIRRVEQYVVHPNELRNLGTGRVAVRSVPGDRHAIVGVLSTL